MRNALMALLLALSSLASAAPPLQPAEAVDIAGRQRMLSQRMVKAYAQLALGVTPGRSRQMLAESVFRFEQQTAMLEEYVRDAEQQQTLANMARRWQVVRELVLAPPDARDATRLDDAAEELLQLAQVLAGQIEAASPGAAGEPVVNLAGRQRMLSQRLAKAYMLRALGIDSPRLRGEIESAQIEFGAALQKLQRVPQNTAEIRRELNAIAVQWEWFRTALELEGAFTYRQLVADASESILASMENVVALYMALGWH